MPYPRFTNVIISHFISKDKTIFIRNKINLHTIQDDSLLGILKFVSKTEDYQKYGALIPEEMINQYIKDSQAYKTYLDFATRKATPKKASITKAAQLKKALKKSKQDTHMLYASGSGEGVGSQPKVPDEKQEETTGDSDDDSNDDYSDGISNDVASDANGDNEASDIDRTDSDDDENPNLNQNNDDEEEYEEEYDVNVRLKDAEHEEEGKGDAEKTDTGRDDFSQEKSYDSSISSNFASQFLNLNNVPPADNEVVSMMNVKVHHEEPSTQGPSHLTIPVTVILESSTATATTIPTPIPTRLEDSIQKAFRSYTIEFKKNAQAENKRYIDLIEKSVKDIIKDKVKSQLPYILPKEVSDYATPVIQSTITESLENVVLAQSSSQPKSTYEAATSLIEFELKKILLDKMQKSKSYQGAQEYKKLYDGLVALKSDWFKKPERPPTPDPNWNARKSVKFRPLQTWISKIAQADKPPLFFNELMSTPIDFSTYVMNNFKIDNLTQELLVGLAYNLLKGTCRHEYPFDLSKPLSLIEDQGRQVVPVDYFFNNDLEKYTTSTTKTKAVKYDDIQGIEDMVPSDQREDQQLYKFKEGEFPNLHLQDIKDMLLLLVQKKLSNLERDVIFDLGITLMMFTRRIIILKRVEDLQLGVESYQKKLNIMKPDTFRFDISNRTPQTTYNNPQGIIYVDKYKRNRLMRSDELYKFYDGTLTFVRTVLHDIASNLRIDYLPKRKWSKVDRKRSRIMIKAIHQQRFKRRLIRNLEKFVGGRYYREDFRLLEQTI
nr:hypothetical protein [Tanacetum cinerariifolium]